MLSRWQQYYIRPHAGADFSSAASTLAERALQSLSLVYIIASTSGLVFGAVIYSITLFFTETRYVDLYETRPTQKLFP